MDDIINLFVKEHGIYQQMFKFNVIIVFIIIILILIKLDIFKGSVYMLIAFMFALYITNIYVKFTQNDLTDDNKMIHLKLITIQSKIYEYVDNEIKLKNLGNLTNIDKKNINEKNMLDSLYLDANLIVFLHSILQLYEYNPNEYYLLVKGTNNILKLRNDIEIFYKAEEKYPENIHEMLQIAIQLKTNCMNNLQNFIYTVPKENQMYEYIDNILNTYNILISRNIKIIHNYQLDYIQKNGINTMTTFIDIHGSKAFDPLANKSLIPGKEGLKHNFIDLYV